MLTPQQVESALSKVTDQASFIQTLLIDTLGWPVNPDAKDVEEITYKWAAAELRAAGLNEKVVGGSIRQIPPAEDCPWGIFIIEFESDQPFGDDAAGRGMSETLRKILRGLVPSKRKASQLTSFKREHLLFICTHKYKQFRFAYFKDPGEAFKTPPLISFGWTPGGAVKTVSKYNLRHLEWMPAGTSTADWLAEWTQAFDVERVTKKFFSEFAEQHQVFLDHVHGIDDERDRRWYVSALLNRLMFVYFLQKRGFIDGGRTDYLEANLKVCRKKGKDRFYGSFLKLLFFEGFAKPEDARSPAAKAILGAVRYLNGGLFLPHPVEQQYPKVSVDDAPFASLFDLFAYYSWNLDDTPGGSDNEINPDVLGYIFEKYINQKEFGAYYTRPEITDYLCEKTIHRLVLEAVNTPSGPTAPGVPVRAFDTVGDLLAGLDNRLAERLLDEILPGLSLLDPACGSGAFLIAALKAMIDIYKGLFAWIEFDGSAKLKGRLAAIRNAHPSLAYFIKKEIITRNIYGVDLMDEATEIARLRLFLALVASADKVEDLEPLPNIDFNILAGNSLIGLIKVDEGDFDKKGEAGNMFAGHYREILAKKNRLTRAYRNATTYSESLAGLRDEIAKHNDEAIAVLNDLLLREMQDLGVRYHQVGWDDKKHDAVVKSKRSLLPRDVAALTPFHWAYVFDEIMVGRGGFDAIITNPPWEVFKPNGKEFFENHSELVSKKSMTINDFEKEQATLLRDKEVRAAWIGYLEQFPHVSAYFRSADQYTNQISIVGGKKAGTDINLYKLFIELCFRLLRPGGRCGIIVTSGIYTDLGSKQLREMLFSECKLEALLGLSNEKWIFEGVHHAQRICIVTFQRGGPTERFRAAFRINPREAVHPAQLREFLRDQANLVTLDTALVRQLSPDSLSIMEFKGPLDVLIAGKMLRFPMLGGADGNGWRISLAREFDMTQAGGSRLVARQAGKGLVPLYEGKLIWQFDHRFSEPQVWVDPTLLREFLFGADYVGTIPADLYRLAYRRQSASTNERTLIATVIPPAFHADNLASVDPRGTDGTRTMNAEETLYLAALLNSFVIDFSVRQRVANNLNFFFLYQLSVPLMSAVGQAAQGLVSRAARLICTTPEFDKLAQTVGIGGHEQGAITREARAQLRAEIDGMVAHIYSLTEAEFAHILQSFPLVDQGTKGAALDAFRALAVRNERTGSAVHTVEKLIAAGESATIEFKETAKWDVRGGKAEKFIEDIVVKTVAAMLNSQGGTLVIGVSDDGLIQGLERDYSTLGQRPNKDGFEQWLVARFNADLGKDITPTLRIEFAEIEGKDVCVVHTPAAARPVFVVKEGQEKLYVRTGNASNELKPSEFMKYSASRWPGAGA